MYIHVCMRIYIYTYVDLYIFIYVHISPLHRGHAHLFCAVPVLTDDPPRKSTHIYIYIYMCMYIYIYI